MEEKVSSGKKIVHIEVIRMLAVLCIIYIHTGDRGYNAYATTISHPTFELSIILKSIGTIGVQLFWMVSGALLLDKKEPLSAIYKKRVPRMLTVLFIFSVIRYLFNHFVTGEGKFGLFDFAKGFVSGNIFLPYWFIYFYIGMLLLLPFARMVIEKMTLKDWNYVVVMELIFLVIVRVIELIPNTIVSVPFYVPQPINALFLGYFAEKIVPEELLKKKGAPALMGLACIAIVAIEFGLSVTIGNPVGYGAEIYDEFMLEFLALFLVLFVRAVALKDISWNPGLVKFTVYAGGCSFGLYLIEDYLRNGLIFVDDMLAGRITTLPACMVWVLCVYAVGLVVVGLMKRIPWLGKLI